MRNLVICGDSFSVGIGCTDLNTEPYGALLAKEFESNIKNFAKGSSTNFSIFLQVKYVIENLHETDFVCVGVTCNNRVEWFPEDYKISEWNITNSLVNYHQYPPYGKDTNHQILENPMKNDKNYEGVMFTENYYGIVHYVDNVMNKNVPMGDYFAKFKNERPERLKLLRDYYAEIFDDRIQRQYDIGVITMAHLLLKAKGIKHLILTHDNGMRYYIPNENLVNVNFLELSQKYPDIYNTLHMSPEGHKIIFNEIMKKIK